MALTLDTITAKIVVGYPQDVTSVYKGNASDPRLVERARKLELSGEQGVMISCMTNLYTIDEWETYYNIVTT